MTQYTQKQTEALEFCKKYFIVAVKIRDFVGHFCNSRLLQELLIVTTTFETSVRKFKRNRL